MVEYVDLESAKKAKESLQDKDMYDGCNTIKVEYARTQKLNVYKVSFYYYFSKMTLKLRMTMRLGIILVMNSKNHQAFWVNVPNLIILVPLVIVLKVPTTMHLVIQLWVHMLVVLMDMTKIMVGLEIGIEIELREHKKEERRVMKQIEIQLNSHLC